ncbi:hypothetical protein [Methylosinus sp. PW1]|uniref:hypothetical protein n=1 Tax=Methylosinus sp. PW1 TaxID=107636 RepID=UPI00055D895F|nr:hypothetical protein [Methylosinus sp. PW1]
MALVSDLVRAIAEVEGIPPETMDVVARHAREAGYLTTGARGRNAPPATVTDAVNLIIAANAGGCVLRQAPEAVALYRRLATNGGFRKVEARGVNREYFAIEDEPIAFLSDYATLGEALEKIIDGFVSGDLEKFLLMRAMMTLHEREFDAMNREHPDEPARVHALIERAQLALRAGLTIQFALTFNRPLPSAILEISTVGGPIAKVEFAIHADDFTAAEQDGRLRAWCAADRQDSTTIGYRTLSRIGDALRGAPLEFGLPPFDTPTEDREIDTPYKT